jgi:hypothetical protein
MYSLLVLALALSPSWCVADSGRIRGVVVNASKGNAPVAGAEVVLRIQEDGGFVPVAATAADDRGRFRFDDLPTQGHLLFSPGASHDGVYYPGPRLRLGPETSTPVTLQVFDTITEPCPLVELRHEVLVRPEPGLLSVTESIVVSNPTSACYVGPPRENDRTVTLRLSIADNFEKVTFHNEFFGRRFVLSNGKLVTNVPWPPGDRELQFTYIVPVTKEQQGWERPLDLPCSRLIVRVASPTPESVSCNLGVTTQQAGQVTFDSENRPLPPGYVVQVGLGSLRLPAMFRARWIALAVLGGLIAAGTIAILARRRTSIAESRPSGAKLRLRAGRKPRRLCQNLGAGAQSPG